MKLIKFFLIFVLAVVFIVLCVANREMITLSLFPFPYSVSIPVFILFLLSMAVGAVITGFMLNIQIFRMRHLVKNTKQRMQAVEDENKSLRSEREFILPALTDK
ncbi:MAG: LapA family protein [Pseudomonadota bacterium]|mgnify:CR=1 FL=1